MEGDTGRCRQAPEKTICDRTRAVESDFKSNPIFPILSDFPILSTRAGPKGLRAESARAFTGRHNSHSGRGEDFFSRQPNFFTETAVTPERKVEKWFPRWEINRHAEG